jgi:hypothetical protein
MKDELVSFETAKLAKEKGFNWETDKLWANYYSDEPINKWKLVNREGSSMGFCEYNAPTQSLLQKWLRDNYGLSIEIKTPDGLTGKWNTEIHKVRGFGNYLNGSTEFDTYEEALEVGLMEALNLV